jgi:predicted XRE-type DNA-binding protein
MGALTNELISKLREWCEKEEGRKKEVSAYLGLPQPALSNMFRAKDPQQPTGEQALAIQAFLKKYGRRKPKVDPD